jgi:hypothetical protein
MPISTFSDLSLSHIFQELPSLVSSHGLFVEVNGLSNATSHVGDITLKVTTYTGSNGRLKESRLQRKMCGLPAAPSPCTYCIGSDKILAPDTCPLCLTPTQTPGWVKETTTANVKVDHSANINVTSSHSEILAAFLAPLFHARLKHYEEHHENIERVAATAAATAEAEKRKRRGAVYESS